MPRRLSNGCKVGAWEVGLRSLFLTLLVLACAGVSGCTTLTAPAPLFSTVDQIGPAPLREGVWIGVNDECPPRYAHRRIGRFPKECAPMEIRRQADGAWLVTLRADLMSTPPDADAPRTPVRVIIVPAIEHPTPDSFAPLYVAQFAPDPSRAEVLFFGLAPTGVLPATSLVYVDMSCTAILRDGAVAGVALAQQPVEPPDQGAPATTMEAPLAQNCIATTQGGVREAARRALVERFSIIAQSSDRLVFVRDH